MTEYALPPLTLFAHLAEVLAREQACVSSADYGNGQSTLTL